MSYVNTNLETGIRFGYISAHSLDPDLLNELTIYNGTDLSYEEAVSELRLEVESAAENLEEECRIAIIERGGCTDREYEDLLEKEIEAAYERLGYSGREDYIETRIERESEFIEIDEPIYEGEYEGVKYRTSWLGGAQNVWIFESPVIVKCDLCSPCVPNAGNLDCPNPDGYDTYGVPADWLYKED